MSGLINNINIYNTIKWDKHQLMLQIEMSVNLQLTAMIEMSVDHQLQSWLAANKHQMLKNNIKINKWKQDFQIIKIIIK